MNMLIIFLSVFLCSQYAACVPVESVVHSQEADEWLRLHLVPASWTEAAVLCQLEGEVLASPTTSALSQAMLTAMTDHKLSSGVFIGVTDMLSKGEFKSLDGAAVADIPLEWAAGEPNNADDAEHCLALTGAGALADVSCSAVLPYFCRKESARNHDSTPEVPPCNGKIGYQYEPRTGSCYKFHGVAQAWLPARKTCRAEGGHLAIINSHAESTVLKEIRNKNENGITGTYDPKFVIIGFMKSADNEWLTINGETLSEAGFDEWDINEPNNLGGEENCGNIHDNGLLNDCHCQEKFAFICEITL